jgi:hypothetical protein
LAGDGNSDYGLFNADGWLMPDGRRSRESYSQLFRSGRLEAVKGGLCYSQNGGKIIRERQCEEAVLRLVPAYFRFCKNIGIEGPIWFFSSLLGCEGAHFRVNPHFSDYSEHAIGERLVTLPEFYFVTLDGDVSSSLRAWCDAFWQTVGVEKSLNYDQDGKRNAQRHR